jgi:hypothetical protein
MNSLKDTTTFDIDALVNFFDPSIQDGAGAEAFVPRYRRQRGAGIGSIFASIGRWLLPFAKKFVLPNVVDMAKNVASDVMNSGGSIKESLTESLKERGKQALKNTAANIMGQSGSGKRRRTRSRTKSVKRTPTLQLGRGRKRKRVKRAKNAYKIIRRPSCYD